MWLECIHTHTQILLSYKKKNEMVPFAVTWVNLENIVLSEVSHTEKDKYSTHMWHLKNNTSESI